MTRSRLHALAALYPRRWRERYQDEFADLLTAMSADRPSRLGRLRLAADVVRGALDAHLHWAPQPGSSRSAAGSAVRRCGGAAVRRAILDAVAIATALATVLIQSNVVFPAGPGVVFPAATMLSGLLGSLGGRLIERQGLHRPQPT